MDLICASCGTANLPTVRHCSACGLRLIRAPEGNATRRVRSLAAGRPDGGPAMPHLTGTLLAQRYAIVAAIAQGGMGGVYEAQDTHLSNRRCAVKVLLDAGGTPQDQSDAQAWFAREAQLLSRIRHPAIPAIHDYFSDDGGHYLVMDFIAGQTLEDALASRGAPGLPAQEVIQWGEQLCDVLDYLHNQRPPLIFRDLKPANIMVDTGGSIKLIDFGIARWLDADSSVGTRHTMIGTPGYCPPEQYQGIVTPRSDIYALGATLHHLLSGRDPRLHPPCTYPPLSTFLDGGDASLEATLSRALQFQADRRFASAREMGLALRNSPPPQAPPPSSVMMTTVASTQVQWPHYCACCGGASDMYYHVGATGPGATREIARTWDDVPYCATCVQHATAADLSGELWGTHSFVWAAVGFLACGLLMGSVLPGATAWVIAMCVALILGANGLRVKGRVARATRLMKPTCCRVTYAVGRLDGSDGVSTFFFYNRAYDAAFVAANRNIGAAPALDDGSQQHA